ncbi:cell division cycle protein-like protein 23 [Nemania sp. FL0031]|nr:cell division cycle protein-like protein 23 [Nemania sp. FL0031]
MSLSRPQIIELQNALRQAVIACSQRCLYQSARWAAELLNSLPVGDDDDADASLYNPGHSKTPALQTDASELLLEQTEMPKYLLAKTLFDCHEFQRCAETLLPSSPSALSIIFPKKKDKSARPPRKGISQRGLFLACYALLIQGEKEKTENASVVLGPSDTGAATNKNLPEISSILEKWLTREKNPSGRESSEGWLEYLYGMTLAKTQNSHLAKTWLLRSVSVNPWNWGAWQELRCLVRDAKDLDLIYSHLQPSIVAFLFSVYCRQELDQASPSLLSDISQLQKIFPHSAFLKGQRALVFYRMKDTESARSVFSDMLISHPRYFDFIDHYSNILYGLHSKGELAFIAQIASSVEPYRPETLCVAGNYYSLSSRHEDAVIYFRRALILDRSFAPAWMLLGREYLKLDNSHAALSAYLRAISLNPHEYKAYYGLAQLYEFLEQPLMALGFFHRAVSLRPGEVDIWRTIATCLENLSKLPQAVASLKKALACTDSVSRPPKDGTGDNYPLKFIRRLNILLELSRLHEELHDQQEATSLLERCLDEANEYYPHRSGERDTNVELKYIISRAQLSLAQWALDSGDFARAQHFASQVKEPGEAAEEAQRLLEEIALEDDNID